MPSLKTITVSLPVAMGKEIEKVAKAEHRTVSELIREAFRQYQSQRNLKALASEGRSAAKKNKVSAKDFGGPFEEQKSDMQQITVCLDANVYISGIAFGGKPLKILEKALSRDFHLVTGPNILDEVRRNLISKLGVKSKRVDQFLSDIAEVSSVFVPTGKVHFISHAADNLVLELAIAGSCDILVTGDKKHLLPLGTFNGLIIESPSAFLNRLEHFK